MGLLLSLGPKRSSKGGGSDGDTRNEAKRSGAAALIKAVKAGDESATAEAFSALYDACGMAGPSEPDDDDKG